MTAAGLFDPIPSTFSGLIWEPSNEQDVVMLFGMLVAIKQFGEPLCIQSCATAFPDCEAINTNTGQSIKIEFEYRSSAFECHKEEWESLRHLGPAVRWMIVCWEDNLKRDEYPGLEVVALQNLVKASGLVKRCVPPDIETAEARFEWRAGGLEPDQQQVLKHLRDFGKINNCGFRIEWPKRDDFSFICKSDSGLSFCASAMGAVVVPFSKWDVNADVKLLVIEKLNAALPHLDFTKKAGSKKGYDLEVLLPNDDAVTRFLQAWKDVATELNKRP